MLIVILITFPSDAKHGQNQACGEDSDCINRATKIECVGDCGCGPDCRNQRFQKKQYSQVSVIKTEKKGFGLRAESNLEPHQLIFEYVGEVVGEAQFRRRMRQYDEEGIKHFYFMSLNKGEFVDATKRGNLGRFCNHSCNPNCYVDKWVVGEKLRMGIFAERAVEAGEELVFNYNVDRYGADPQPCYCAEPNCTGFIGGRTQTEQATKLSNATIEALGIDEEDAWDTVVARRPKKKKTEENDEEYVDSVQPKSLQEDGVTKVMAALMQCQEKWIAVKLLGRIQRCEDERVSNRVVKMHGYQILNSQLAQWKEDYNVVLQILDILDKFPRMTRNKIIDSKIETNIQPLTTCGDERVAQKAIALLADWADLKVGYRIPRMKRDEQAKKAVNQFERRESGREQRQRSVTRSPSPSYEARQRPTQPRRERLQHQQNQRPRPNRRRQVPDRQLPDGWFQAENESGRFYYYTADGKTTWQKPTAPATPAAPTAQKKNLALQSIIDGIVNSQEKTPTSEHKSDTPGTPQPASDHQEKKREDKGWRKLPIEKQKKLYENTVCPISQPTSRTLAN
jgi:histone-lysine N-methyltransferase SETD2